MYKCCLILCLLFVSCGSTSHIIVYKDKEIVMTPTSTNSIKDFQWAYKYENSLDSVVFNRKHGDIIKSLVANMEKVPGLTGSIGTPRYAFVLEYNNKKDTLYFYDFNDEENYKNIGYLVQNNIALRDTNDEFKKYLVKNYPEFINREYYSLPNSNKEYHYIKE